MLKSLSKSMGFKFHSSKVFNAKIEIFIDDKPYQAENTHTIWQAAYENNVIIPRFCFHETLSVAGNCRMCLVEVEKVLKPQPACAVQIMPGMHIRTLSDKTRRQRGAVVEFLLNNHPLDCPICDQGGECDLQDISHVYGYGAERFKEYRRAVENKNYGPLVGTEMTRCIHCTRCIRFTNEYSGVADIGKVGRGLHAEISTYVEKMLDNELSANIVDLCPVGALTSLPYAFTCRPHELHSVYSIDTLDSLGSNIQIDAKNTEIMRILPRVHEEINQEWLSDKSRYAFDGLKKQRVSYPYQKNEDGQMEESDWREGMELIAEKIKGLKGNEIACAFGEFTDLEAAVCMKDFLNRLDSDNFEVRGQSPDINIDFRSNYLFNSSIEGVSEADVLLLVGCNIKYESPLINSRIMRQVRDGNLKVFTVGAPFDLKYPTVHLGNSTDILKEIQNGTHKFSERFKKAQLPMIIYSQNMIERTDGKNIHNTLQQIALSHGVINTQLGWNGLNMMHKHSSTVGLMELGIVQKRLQKPKFVFLLGADNNLTSKDLEGAFVVYIGSSGDKGAYLADVILPSFSCLEKEGTYVNTEGRPQLTKKSVSGPGISRNDWEIIRALSEVCGAPIAYNTLNEVRNRIAEIAPHLLKIDYLEPTIFGKLSVLKQDNQINSSQIIDYMDNYYMNNSISRNSTNMAKCSLAFNKIKNDSFIQ